MNTCSIAILILVLAISSFGHRVKRLTEAEFGEAVAKMEMMGRVMNGISLVIGVSEGSISSDEVIGELMNVGRVDLDSLENFKRKEVDDVMNKMKTVDILLAGHDQDYFEEVIKLEYSWGKRYSGLQDIKNKEKSNEYFAEIDIVKDVKIRDDFCGNMTESITNALPLLKSLTSLPDTFDGNGYGTYFDILRDVREKLESISNYSQKVLDASETLLKLENLKNYDFPVKSPQAELVDLVSEYFKKKARMTSRTPQTKESLKNHLLTISEMSKKFKGRTNFNTIRTMIESRLRNPKKTVTSGFSNGFSDIQKLASDTQTIFFDSFTGNASKVIKKGMGTLAEWTDGLNALDGKWRGMFTEKNLQNIEQAAEMVKMLEDVTVVTPSEADGLVNKAEETALIAAPNRSTVDDIEKVLDKARRLTRRLGVMIPLGKKISGLSLNERFADVDYLKGVINFSDDVDNVGPEFKAIVAKMRAFSKFQVLIEELGSLNQILKTLKAEFAKDDLEALLGDVASKGKNAVNGFIESSETDKWLTFFDGLGKTDELGKIIASIRVAEKLRDLKNESEFFGSVDSLASSIVDSVGELKKVRETVGEMKKNQRKEVKEMKQLKGVEKEMATVGESIQFMKSVQNTMKKKGELENMINEGMAVNQIIENNLVEEVTRDWTNFSLVADNVTFVLAELSKSVTKINTSTFEKLTDFIPVFSAFTNLRDVDLQVEKRKRVLEFLVPSLSAPDAQTVNSFQSSLSRSHSDLDLMFASHQSAVSSMNTVLRKTAQLFQQVSGTSNSPTDDLNPSSLRPSDSTPPAHDESNDYILWIVLLLLAIVVLIIVFYKCCQKKMEKKKKAEQKKPHDVNKSPTDSPDPPEKKSGSKIADHPTTESNSKSADINEKAEEKKEKKKDEKNTKASPAKENTTEKDKLEKKAKAPGEITEKKEAKEPKPTPAPTPASTPAPTQAPAATATPAPTTAPAEPEKSMVTDDMSDRHKVSPLRKLKSPTASEEAAYQLVRQAERQAEQQQAQERELRKAIAGALFVPKKFTFDDGKVGYACLERKYGTETLAEQKYHRAFVMGALVKRGDDGVVFLPIYMFKNQHNVTPTGTLQYVNSEAVFVPTELFKDFQRHVLNNTMSEDKMKKKMERATRMFADDHNPFALRKLDTTQPDTDTDTTQVETARSISCPNLMEHK